MSERLDPQKRKVCQMEATKKYSRRWSALPSGRQVRILPGCMECRGSASLRHGIVQCFRCMYEEDARRALLADPSVDDQAVVTDRILAAQRSHLRRKNVARRTEQGYPLYGAQAFDRLPQHGLTEDEHQRDCEAVAAMMKTLPRLPAVTVQFRRDHQRCLAACHLARPALAALLAAVALGVLGLVLRVIDGGDTTSVVWIAAFTCALGLVMHGGSAEGPLGALVEKDPDGVVHVAGFPVAHEPTFVPAVIVGGSQGRTITRIVQSAGWELAARSSSEFLDALEQVHLRRALPADVQVAVELLPGDQSAQQIQTRNDERTRVAEQIIDETIAAVEAYDTFAAAQRFEVERQARHDRAKLTVDRWSPRADSLDSLSSDRVDQGADH